MAESARVLKYTRGGVTYDIKTYTDPADVPNSVAVRVGGETVYVGLGDITHEHASFIRVQKNGATWAVISEVSSGWSGTGTPLDPFTVATVEDYHRIGTGVDGWTMSAHYKQIANIDFDGVTPIPIGYNGTSAPTYFTGVYDGDGYTISNFAPYYPDIGYIGLFYRLNGSGCVVKNVNLVSPAIAARYGVGGITGRLAAAASMLNCGTYGGYVTALGSSGYTFAGGLCGFVENYQNCTVTKCFNAGTAVTSNAYAGGLCGHNAGATFTDCYSIGSVTALGTHAHPNLGTSSFAGSLSSIIAWSGRAYNCYASGAVTAPTEPAGITTRIDFGGVVSGCYWDTESTGTTWSAAGTGKTTAEMYQQATFVGWDFTNTWTIDEGNSAPVLQQ